MGVEGDAVDDRGDEAWVGEDGSPFAEREVTGESDAGSFFAFARRVPFNRWTFVNAELTVHLAREPVGSWVGIDADGILAPNGCGVGVSQLYDADGRFGQSASALLLEARSSGS